MNNNETKLLKNYASLLEKLGEEKEMIDVQEELLKTGTALFGNVSQVRAKVPYNLEEKAQSLVFVCSCVSDKTAKIEMMFLLMMAS